MKPVETSVAVLDDKVTARFIAAVRIPCAFDKLASYTCHARVADDLRCEIGDVSDPITKLSQVILETAIEKEESRIPRPKLGHIGQGN